MDQFNEETRIRREGKVREGPPTPREAMAARKAKADAVLTKAKQEKMKVTMAQRREFVRLLDAKKNRAATDNLLDRLADPRVKEIRHVDNRPAEKLALKSKGLKRNYDRSRGRGM